MNKTFLTSTVCAFLLLTSSLFTAGCAAQGSSTKTPNATQGSSTRTPMAGQAAAQHPGLMDPTKATERAPDKFNVTFTTTKGDIVVQVTRVWAPNGADRFYNLAKIGYYNDIAIFRAIDGFMFQFGIHGNPNVSAKWRDASITDDPFVGISNTPGTLSFAQTGQPNSRSVQSFVNLGANSNLDKPRRGSPFVPFGVVLPSSMEVVKKITTEYGENAGSVQGNFQQKGNAYIKATYPNIDYIKSATVVEVK